MATNELVDFPHVLAEENSFKKSRNALIWILPWASTSTLLPETETP